MVGLELVHMFLLAIFCPKIRYCLADFHLLIMAKFTNFASPQAKTANYRGWVTDGIFKTELELPFQPHFLPGQEIRIRKVTPHFIGML